MMFFKNDDENGQLLDGIYSSPAAARLPLQKLDRQSLDTSKQLVTFSTK